MKHLFYIVTFLGTPIFAAYVGGAVYVPGATHVPPLGQTMVNPAELQAFNDAVEYAARELEAMRSRQRIAMTLPAQQVPITVEQQFFATNFPELIRQQYLAAYNELDQAKRIAMLHPSNPSLQAAVREAEQKFDQLTRLIDFAESVRKIKGYAQS